MQNEAKENKFFNSYVLRSEASQNLNLKPQMRGTSIQRDQYKTNYETS